MFEGFMAHLSEKAVVLDLGAGKGHQATSLAAAGHSVVAVDRMATTLDTPGIQWNVTDIVTWLKGNPAGNFDAALLRNCLQFFPRDVVTQEVLPMVRNLLRPGGIVGIATFLRAPEPAWPKPHPSYWRATEIAAHFTGWRTLFQEEKSNIQNDLEGQPRLFHLTNLIMQKS